MFNVMWRQVALFGAVWLLLECVLYRWGHVVTSRNPTATASSSSALIHNPNNICPIVVSQLPSHKRKSHGFVPTYRPILHQGKALSVPPRAFRKRPLPCHASESAGLWLMRPYRAASTVAASVHYRMARNRGSNATLCAAHMLQDHSTLPPTTNVSTTEREVRLQLQATTRDNSFVWTLVRDPTLRAMSHFFTAEVAGQKATPADAHFLKFLETHRNDVHQRVGEDYYAQWLPFSSDVSPFHSTMDPMQAVEYLSQHILERYDFIGLVERLDESMVLLSFLLQVPLEDVVYIESSYQRSQGWSPLHPERNQCNFLIPTFATDGMQAYFASEDWQRRVQWDQLLVEAVSRSMDITIDQVVGRPAYDAALQRYRHYQAHVEYACASKLRGRCTDGGSLEPLTRTNCLVEDVSCGNKCIDETLRQLQQDPTLMPPVVF
jgi:hypothetical protein